MLYFAYGSNMHPERLRRRVPSREAIGVTELAGYTLAFSKRGRDGSGKCTLIETEQRTARVHGVLYRIDPVHRVHLDEAEGLGFGYEALSVEVSIERDRHRAFTYIAQAGHVDRTLMPFDWYKALVVEGARHHGLHEAYLDVLRAVPAIEDPDAERSALHREILASLA
jgi:gamma-glutamylcyclotransferase (GGCT)/AIG2-like uncharacterized protein YtfP